MAQSVKTTFTKCPFCNSEQIYDKLHTRFYKCGTQACRLTGRYKRGC